MDPTRRRAFRSSCPSATAPVCSSRPDASCPEKRRASSGPWRTRSLPRLPGSAPSSRCATKRSTIHSPGSPTGLSCATASRTRSPRPSVRGLQPGSCSSPSTTPRASTTPTVTRPATPCSWRAHGACRLPCVPATRWRGSAATSSSRCASTSTPTRRWLWPGVCRRRSARRSAPPDARTSCRRASGSRSGTADRSSCSATPTPPPIAPRRRVPDRSSCSRRLRRGLVAIAGGHGKIGPRLTGLLVARGDTVIGLIRNPDHAADVRSRGADPVVCDLEHATVEEIAAAVAGAERKLTMDRDGAIKLLNATAADAPPYVIVSSVGAEKPPPESDDDVFSVYLRAKAQADAAVRASERPWTIVRPGALTDDPGTGRIRIDTDPFRGQVTRDDVAEVLAAVLYDGRAVGRILYVNGGNEPIAEALDRVLATPLDVA